MTVHTNLEATALILATGFLGHTPLEAALIIGSFAFGTGLHLACHLLVAVAFGKGIRRMVLTRAAVFVSLTVMLGMAIAGVVWFQPVLIYLAVVISYDNWRKHLRAPLPATGATSSSA